MKKQVKYQHLQSLAQLCFKFLSHRCLLKCNKLPNGQLIQVKIVVINMFLNRVCVRIGTNKLPIYRFM